jgi:hypothetical protein
MRSNRSLKRKYSRPGTPILTQQFKTPAFDRSKIETFICRPKKRIKKSPRRTEGT